jgi:two-component system, OmpR family, phosphate regulon sensor histidine kinase PhoR
MSAAPGTLNLTTLRAAAARHQQRLKHAVALLQPIAARIVDRRVELGLFAALALVLVALASLSLKAALLSGAGALLWAGLWPRQGSHPAAELERGRQSIGEQALWRVAIDAVPVPIVVLDGAGNLMHANAMAAELFGSRRLAGHIASVSRAPELLDAVDAALANNETRLVELHERIPLERRLMVTVAPLGGVRAHSEQPALMIAFRDLSDQDRLARMRADFVANASHELRTPLASLKGFVETLQGTAKDDPAARERFLKVMSEQAGRMTRLIDDLLSLSRVEMREHLPLGAVVDLNDVFAHVVQSLQPLAAESGTTVDVQRTEQPAEVRGDRDELVQVFQNLIHNAIKYGRQGGRVEITLARQAAAHGRPAQIVAAVSDDGPGIAPQHLPRLTERFYRVSVAASREKGGTGLGLAIVKHILNRHRGELTISSAIGQGSTFRVALPAARA